MYIGSIKTIKTTLTINIHNGAVATPIKKQTNEKSKIKELTTKSSVTTV